jgi:hypothetical protein
MRCGDEPALDLLDATDGHVAWVCWTSVGD